MSQGVAKFVVLACIATLVHSCDLVHRPDCAVLPPGSLHPHEASCSYFYRCDEFHNAKAYSCPSAQRFLNQDGDLCVPEALVTCDRCPQAASRCGDCSCSPTTPPPCLTTTQGPCTLEPTTESPTSWLPSSSTSSTGVSSSTTERITESTTERFTPQDCPPIPSCVGSASGTLRPYPPDCSKFLYCDDYDVAKLVSCNIGEHFSPTELKCMSINEANCPICVPDYTIPDMTTVTYYPLPDCPPIPDCFNKPPGSVQPYPPDCSKYVYCLDTLIPDIASCPPGQHFSPNYLTCLLPEIADCPICISSTTTTPAPTTLLPDCAPISSCKDVEAGSKLPFPQDCGMFIYCESQTDFSLVLCAAGKYFSPTLRQCTVPEIANCPICNPGVTPYPTPTPICPPTPDCSNSNPGDKQPYPPDCNLFIQCISSSEYKLISCPTGQHFSPYQLRCELIEQADCPSCINAETTTTVTTTEVTVITTTATSTTGLPDCEPIPSCIFESPGSKLPFPQNCEIYIYCESQTDFSLVFCEAGKHFSPTLRQCTSPESANCPICNPGVTPYPTPSPICPPTPNCSDSIPDDVRPYPPDCNLFIQCINSNEYELISCPTGQQFSPYRLRCELIEQADCPLCINTETTTTVTTTEVTVITTTATSTTGLPECEPIPSCIFESPGSKLPFPQNCEIYIYCKSQTDFSLVFCEAGKHFSPTLRQCTSPESANCPICNPGVTPYPTPSPVCPPTPNCSDSIQGDVQPYPPDCNRFIQCINSSDYELLFCPLEQHFSPYRLLCEPIEQAECPSCINIESTTEATMTTEVITTETTTDETTTIVVTTVTESTTTEATTTNESTTSTEASTPTESTTEATTVTDTTSTTELITTEATTTSTEATTVTESTTEATTVTESTTSTEATTIEITTATESTTSTEATTVTESTTETTTVTESTTTEATTNTESTTSTEATTTSEFTTTDPPTSTIAAPICPPPRICNVQPILIQVPPKESYPPDCSKYQYCYDREKPYISSCPTGQHFSPTMLECMDPELAQCVNCVEPTQ